MCLLSGCARPAPPARPVSWQQLGGFPFEPSVHPKRKSPRKVSKLPQRVLELQHQRLELAGYMVPVEVDGEQVRSFVLVKDQQSCCYSRVPALNEFVWVNVGGLNQTLQMDTPLQVVGQFEVGEEIQEGVVVSLYRMAAERITPMQGKQAGWIAN